MVGDGDGTLDESLIAKHRLTEDQEKGLRWAFYGFLFFLFIMGLLTIPEGALLRNAKGGFLPKSPLFEGIIVIIGFAFVATGIPYAAATGTIKEMRDIPRLVSAGLQQAIPLLTTTLIASLLSI